MTRLLSVKAVVILAALVVSLGAVTGAAADPSDITRKQAEAASVLQEINTIDMEVGRAAEAYNLANIKLDKIADDRRRNARMLRLAKRSLSGAQRTLAERAVTLYTSGGGESTMEILLGARSMSDLLERLDAADRVSTHDHRVLSSVKKWRGAVQQERSRLANAFASQRTVVSQRAAAKQSIEQKLAERQQLLSSIKGEIERLKREEAARQAELERQARARLAAQQRAARTTSAASTASAPEASSPSESADGASAETTAAAPPATHGGVVGIAMQYLGVPYQWGGASPSGFDCSGFTMYVYAQVGVSLPHYTGSQWSMGSPVSRGDLQPGDLVFFNGLGHVGLYIGGGSFIHSPHTGDVVKISSLSGWYASTYMGARRI